VVPWAKKKEKKKALMIFIFRECSDNLKEIKMYIEFIFQWNVATAKFQILAH